MDKNEITIIEVLTPMEPNLTAAQRRNGTTEQISTEGVVLQGARKMKYPKKAKAPTNAAASSFE
jgi:hypothetical protein